MNEATVYLTIAMTGLAGVAMLTSATLSGWRDWLALKRSQLETAHGADLPTPNAGARIEIADLKEKFAP